MPRPFSARVVAWQARCGRHDLPWQSSRDPYRVWLSEVMLQQTQVSTVLAYYPGFLARFPDLHALAAAALDDVLAAWSGLGYYSRARNLHHCAQVIVTDHGGAFPVTSAGLAALPGIGRSTAAAIAAFCFGERAAILDGNVKRVLSRWLGFDADLSRSANVDALWSHATALLPERDVPAYTQGLMDLGATLCLARSPRCETCPVADDCFALREGSVERIPFKPRRLVRGRRETVWLWLRWRDRVWLERRAQTGVWAGLWSLPEYADFDALAAASKPWLGQGEPLPTIEHALTHFDWVLHPRRWTLPNDHDPADCLSGVSEGRWFEMDEALALGLAAPLRRLLTT